MTARTVSGYTLLPLILLLSACASAPQGEGTQPAGKAMAPQGKAANKSPGARAQEKPETLPEVELTSQLLYEFLLGEVALQRGRPDVSLQAYLDLARSTRDPRLARRAAQIAFETRQADKSIEALKLWLELEPDSQQARQMMISVLLGTGKLEEARPWLAQFLGENPDNAANVFHQLPPLLARSTDKGAALKLARELAQPFPNMAEARLMVARMAAAAGQREEALSEARKTRALRSDWDEAALFEAQLLLPNQPEQALAALKEFLAANPKAGEVRLVYARLLVEHKHFKEGRAEFQRLLDDHPDNADLAFAVAMLSLEMGELEQAEKQLQQALARGKKDRDTVYYYLGQLDEAKKNIPAAIQQYDKVHGGEYAFAARVRQAYLLSTLGKVDEARDLLHHVPAQNDQQEMQLVLMEAAILRDARQYEPAYAVLQQGLEKHPDEPDLMYEAALLADRLGKAEVMEQLLRKLISAQPDNANAYNALGYSFLERNVRVDEGMRLVEKAYQLAPNDAAILDSLGWGHYRQGNLEKSLEFLRRAYAADPDPEIAAHLGEVLWLHSNKEEAKKIWSGALKQNPQSESLKQVMKKYLQK